MALTLDSIDAYYDTPVYDVFTQPQYQLTSDDVRACARSARAHGRFDMAINLEALADAMTRGASNLDLTNGESRAVSLDTEHAAR